MTRAELGDHADRYPLDAWPRRKLRSELADELFDAIAMRNCPHYKGEGICINGCYEEPACQTSEPIEGWSTRGPDPKPRYRLSMYTRRSELVAPTHGFRGCQ